MQERVVLLLVVVLVVATATVGVAVNLLRPNNPQDWSAFNVSLTWTGTPALGTRLNLSVAVRAALVDSKTLGLVFLSLDPGGMSILSSTPGTNPWGYATVWNLSGRDLSVTSVFNATVVPMTAGSTVVYAMIWSPRGDLKSVPIDSTGHVNPAGVSLLAVDSQGLLVNTAA